MSEDRTRTALILEPSLIERLRLRHLLINAGFTHVLEAETLPEAITLLGTELVHLVLTGWDVMARTGTVPIKALRNQGRNRDIPVVLLDNGLPQQVIVAAVKAGVAGRLPLPADSSRLNTLLRELYGEEREASCAEHPFDPV